MSKLDRGHEDFVAGHISEDLWTQKSRDWEADLRAVETELACRAAEAASHGDGLAGF
jgi:hypothetical protein